MEVGIFPVMPILQIEKLKIIVFINTMTKQKQICRLNTTKKLFSRTHPGISTITIGL